MKRVDKSKKLIKSIGKTLGKASRRNKAVGGRMIKKKVGVFGYL